MTIEQRNAGITTSYKGNYQEEDTESEYRNDVGVSGLYQSNGGYLHWICQFFRVDRFTTNLFAQLAPGLVGLNIT